MRLDDLPQGEGDKRSAGAPEGAVSRPRGRPRQFSEKDLVRSAQLLFWRDGYRGVSLGHIVEQTGIHKPSLYAAFAGKEGLFLKTLDLYLEETGGLMEQALALTPLRAAVERFLLSDIEVFSSDEGKGGCYFINVFDEASRGNPALAVVAKAVWRRLRERLSDRIERADEIELPAQVTREALVDRLLSLHILLAVRGRTNASRSEMLGYVERLLAGFPEIDRT